MGEVLLVAYQKLIELNQEINRELKSGSTQLERLLDESWKTMKKIDTLPAPKSEQESQQVYVMLSELVKLHRENQELIRQRMTELSQELSQVKKGKAAQSAYQKRTETAEAKFLDQFK